MKIIKCMPSKPLVIHWCICSFSNRLFHPYFSQLKLKPAIYKSRDLSCDCKLKVRKFYVLLILECGGAGSEILHGRYEQDARSCDLLVGIGERTRTAPVTTFLEIVKL